MESKSFQGDIEFCWGGERILQYRGTVVLWSPAKDKICIDQKSLPCTTGRLGDTVNSLAGLTKISGGVWGSSAPEALKVLYFSPPKIAKKKLSWYMFV